MSFKGIHSVYFLGIGGIGMSALARWFAGEGMTVSGYDRTPSPLTDSLQTEGIDVHFEDTVAAIPVAIKENSDKVLIVWTPAMPSESAQLNYFREHGYTLHKRSEILGKISEKGFCIAVAGTHGKTTTSSMIAHLLQMGKLPMTAFLGGISQNYGTNFLRSKKKSKESIFVVEADEFDRSFLRLSPSEAVVTSVDADHLDIYGDETTILEGFKDFIGLIKKKGRLHIQGNALQKLGEETVRKTKVRDYGLRAGKITAENIHARPDSFVFDYHDGKDVIKGLELFIPGYHNVENALAAISVARAHGISELVIREGLKTFRGVKRRFEIHINEPRRVYIDDYAHHPEEIRSLLSSVRAMYPALSITAIFQPHLYTRTRDFAEGFSESLSLADHVLLLDIYPAREKAIEGVSSEMLLEGIQSASKQVIAKEQLLRHLGESSLEVVVTLGAGDIDRLVPSIADFMRSSQTIDEL
ncbi:UDP-N-acetylmuramate--L-alanine ligase [Algoriphagus namhaensis]